MIVVVDGNAALSDVHRFSTYVYCFGGSLDLGCNVLQYIGHYAESMRSMKVAWWCELVCVLHQYARIRA